MSAFDLLKKLKADPESTAATLEEVAAKHVAEFAPDMVRASHTFVAVVAGQHSLAAELFGRAMVEAKAREWFSTCVRKSSPKGEGAASGAVPKGHSLAAAPEKISVGGQMSRAIDGQKLAASGAEPINGGGHYRDAGSAGDNVLPTVEPKSGDGGQSSSAAVAMPLLSPSARPQSAADIKAAGRAAKTIALTVFDTYKLRDGRAIGDIQLHELRRIRAASAQDAELLRRIEQHVGEAVNYAPSATVRAMIGESALQRYIQAGAEAADAA